MVTASRLLGSWKGSGGGRSGFDSKEARGNFGGDRSVQWLDWDGYRGMHVCQDSFVYPDPLFYVNYSLKKCYFFNVLFIFERQRERETERERERERERAGEGQRERETESEAGSRLWPVSTEPDMGLKLTHHEMMT